MSAPTQPETQQEVVRLRSAVMRLARDLRKSAADEGLTPTESSVLGAALQAEGIRMSELAAQEALHPTMLSRVVGRLEEAGYVKRVAATDDRRASIVQATPAGRRTMQRLRQRRTGVLVTKLTQLDEAEHARLLAAIPVLEKLTQ